MQPLLQNMAQQPVVFARNPVATAGAAALLNHTNKEGPTLYKEATTPLTNKFDGEPMNLKLFLDQVCNKAAQFSWMPTLTFTLNGEQKNLCEHYGEISRQDVRTAATTYLTAND